MNAAKPFCRADGFGVAFGRRTVLSSVDLVLPRRGVVTLLGSAGAGKSTLLRALAGLLAAQPNARTWGTLDVAGDTPVLVRQNARLLLSDLRENLASGLPNRSALTRGEQNDLICAHLESLGAADLATRLAQSVSQLPVATQRFVAIARALLASPECLLLDEPTAGLDPDDAETDRVLGLIRREGERRTIVVVVHHQGHARTLGGQVVLLAGGTIREHTPSEVFFDGPASPEGRSWIRTGRCGVPSPDAQPEELRPSSPPPAPPPAHAYPRRAVGPTGFYWLLPGRLGGAPRPGVTMEIQWDIAALERLGTTIVVSLEEELFYEPALFSKRGIRISHFPIVDMRAPSTTNARLFCATVATWLERGEVVVIHCRAGLGRTGTMLAAQLIYGGATTVEAVERARTINPKWIQSQEQLNFLEAFYHECLSDDGDSMPVETKGMGR